ncbi:cytochrome d ubiquinol oxidase subunit II [Lipingzhangella sp. LS1_29]|uniref:Cytochrome d ubiquinol oxidase subunit II n=1 Tax=Lipingzhangella rawalii TaxID=2055835 RepID=A0ABU2H6S6_9ACTN|nr:cytochrome d ubiquinol oxidase subunit II [Lipingzhangella rawalii]MDS1270555.1 cytochrome d ubiquinol oxidase subunit II [Lipingzhangella rawalii]
MAAMEHLAVLLLTVLALGYFILAGCDIGVGMLLPHTCSHPEERRRCVRAMAPLFLGTEVWLVATIGVVAGVFPELKSDLLSWSWPVLLALLGGWVLRDSGLWLWARLPNASWRRFWEHAITAGSWILAGAWGLFLGGVLSHGTAVSLLAVGYAVVLIVLFALRGAAYGTERLIIPAGDPPESRDVAGDPTPGSPAVDAAPPTDTGAIAADISGQSTRWLARAALVAALATTTGAIGGAAVGTGHLAAPDRPILTLGLVAVLVVLLLPATTRMGPWWSHHVSGITLGLGAAIPFAAVHLPGLSPEPATLSLVWINVAPAVPLMILGQVWLYRLLHRDTQRGRTTPAAGVPSSGRNGHASSVSTGFFG